MRNDVEIGVELRQAITDLLVPIQRLHVASEQHFNSLYALTVELLRYYKGKPVVSKGLLSELHTTINVLRAEAQHRKRDESERLRAMSDKLEYAYELLLIDEVPEDRQPGVPRII